MIIKLMIFPNIQYSFGQIADILDKLERGWEYGKVNIMDYLESIATWALEGYSEKQIAEKLGISDRTLRRYKQKNKEILSALDKSKMKANMNVELTLLNSALGYEYEEEEVSKERIVYFDDNGNKVVKETPVTIRVKKRAKPDISAQKYWLNNRKAQYWNDNPRKAINDKELLELKKKEFESKGLEF